MPDKIQFDLVSPERLLLSEPVDMVTIPGSEGDFGVLAGHAPVIASLRPGVITVNGGASGDTRFFVSGGFAEVNALQATVLAEDVLPMAEADAAAIDQRIAGLKEDLLRAPSDADRARLAEALDHMQALRNAL
jgi:F-type H+-transporting ATPase subunit epsilon